MPIEIHTDPKWSADELIEQIIKQLQVQGFPLSDDDKLIIRNSAGTAKVTVYGKISARRER